MEVHPQYAQTSAQELSTVSTVFSTAPSGEKDPVFRGSARSNAFFHTDCGKNFAPPVVNITISSIPVDNFLPIHKGRINSLPLMCRGGCRPCELRLPACRGSCQSEGLTEGVYGWRSQKGTDPSEGCLPLGEGGTPLGVTDEGRDVPSVLFVGAATCLAPTMPRRGLFLNSQTGSADPQTDRFSPRSLSRLRSRRRPR